MTAIHCLPKYNQSRQKVVSLTTGKLVGYGKGDTVLLLHATKGTERVSEHEKGEDDVHFGLKPGKCTKVQQMQYL